MKYLLLFAFLLLAITTAWIFKLQGRHDSLSLSMHVAKSKQASLIFGIFGIVATTAPAVAIVLGLLPMVSAHYFVYSVYFFIFGLMFITVLLPHIEGTRLGAIHNLAAWGLCLFIPIATASILLTGISPALTLVTIIALFIELTLLCITISFGILPKRKHFLYYQLAYLSVFFIHLLILIWNL